MQITELIKSTKKFKINYLDINWMLIGHKVGYNDMTAFNRNDITAK